MNDSTEPFAAIEHSVSDKARHFPSGINPKITLPRKVYEALPAAYVCVGTLLVLGALYVGIDHWPMAGYSAVGLSCIFGGVTLNGTRRKEMPTSANTMS